MANLFFGRSSAPEPAGRIVIGHTTDQSVRIWVQGSKRYPGVTLQIHAAGQADRTCAMKGRMPEDRDYTACLDFDSLAPSTTYQVTASFTGRWLGLSSKTPPARGAFRTFPRSQGPNPEPFSFLLGSCNLPVVGINNLAAQALEVVGFYIAERSLERPIPDRRPRPSPDERRLFRLMMRQRFCREVLGRVIHYSLGLVFLGSGGKWSNQPLLRSPFLKLAGMFASQRIGFRGGFSAPPAGQALIGCKSKATGVVAFDPAVEAGSWDKHNARGFMILTDTRGDFEAGESLWLMREHEREQGIGHGHAIAIVSASAPFDFPDLPRPAFTIHAGDVIYFDFPKSDREPRLDSYRDTYRESWFEDRFQRCFLARGAHYMTLDDHEIVNEFTNDDEAAWSFPPKQYLEAARPAYVQYVHCRHSGRPEHGQSQGPDGSLYYDFGCSAARFFVMDTRTERRRDRDSRMIDCAQMKAFKEWLISYKNDLKFVVSSVPFVAEVVRSEATPGDSSDDKWSGRPFRWQRDEIIDFIEQNAIERVVFLVGDMHCAYHASMSIGDRHRWTRRTLHELAGGPFNQLDLGRRAQFRDAVRLSTRARQIPYDVRLHQFHGNASAVMHIHVTNVPDPRDPRDEVPEIVWRVIRTITDPEATQTNPEQPIRLRDSPPISGRITFCKRWSLDDLPTW
jgi:hypothetical protein